MGKLLKSRLSKEDKKEVGVYVLKNIITNEVYVGSGFLNKREIQHRHALKTLTHNNKNVEAAFIRQQEGWSLTPYPIKFEELTSKENRELAYEIEQLALTTHKDNPLLLNQCKNAKGGDYERSDEQKRKIADANRERVWTDISRNKLKEKNTGKIVSEETRDKLSKAGTGRIFSEETKNKLSDAKLGWKPPQNVLENLNIANRERSIKILVDGNIFDSVNQAAKFFNVDNRTIDARCNSTSGKFDNWQYFKENNDDTN